MINNNEKNNSILNKTLYITRSGKRITVKTVICIIGIIIVLGITFKCAFDIGSGEGRHTTWSTYN